MKTIKDLFDAVRTRFPELASKTDRLHMERYVDDELELNFLWLECLADVLNEEMAAEVPYEKFAEFFLFIDRQAEEGTKEIQDCIDVALVENMFFDVKERYAKPYWQNLPNSIKELYLGFHGQPPL